MKISFGEQNLKEFKELINSSKFTQFLLSNTTSIAVSGLMALKNGCSFLNKDFFDIAKNRLIQEKFYTEES